MTRRLARTPTLRGAATTAVIVLAMTATACGGSDGGSASPSTEPGEDADAPVVVTFQVADDETFKVLLTDPADIRIARSLLDGEEAPSIPNGRLVRDQTGVNEGYSWSVDPEDIEFADVTVEVCDGVPSDVESGVMASDRYCPWSAVVVAVDRAP